MKMECNSFLEFLAELERRNDHRRGRNIRTIANVKMKHEGNVEIQRKDDGQMSLTQPVVRIVLTAIDPVVPQDFFGELLTFKVKHNVSFGSPPVPDYRNFLEMAQFSVTDGEWTEKDI